MKFNVIGATPAAEISKLINIIRQVKVASRGNKTLLALKKLGVKFN